MFQQSKGEQICYFSRITIILIKEDGWDSKLPQTFDEFSTMLQECFINDYLKNLEDLLLNFKKRPRIFPIERYILESSVNWDFKNFVKV